jgi:hypothetical protein
MTWATSPFCRQAALDKARRCWCLYDGARAGTAGVLGVAHYQDAELGRDHVQPLGHVLADGMQRAATAGAATALDINDGVDPRQALG